jgi:hypothetical protein
MLLRRVIEHVRDQNWAAVAIDFAIVVVGVFIGIQVANWNDERGQRLVEADYLAALASDARYSIDSLHKLIERMEKAQASRRQLYELNLGLTATLNGHEVNALLQGALYNVQRLSVRQVAFEALKNSGQLAIIDDQNLIAELQALDVAVHDAEVWEGESVGFTYNYTDRYLIEEADTENLIIANIISDSPTIEWIRGNDSVSLSLEKLRSLRFKNLLLYQAEMTRGRLQATKDCLKQYVKVLGLVGERLDAIQKE